MDRKIDELLGILRAQGRDDSYCEVKECATSLSKDVWETVSAFANTAGGVIVLGVSEAMGFVPVQRFAIDRVVDQFVSGMGDGGGEGILINPPSYLLTRAVFDGAPVLMVEIDELGIGQKPCFIKARGVQGGSFKRIDDKDVRLSANEIFAMQTAVTVDASDREGVEGASIADLDEAIVNQILYRAQHTLPRSMRGAESQTERLKRLNFIDPGERVTRAGLLVAGVYPQQFFPKLHVDVAVHPGNGKGAGGSLRFTDRAICEGTIGDMIEDAAAAIVKNLRRSSAIAGVGRYDELEIPAAVLREGLANALTHRSYNPRFDGESVAVEIFDDRVEICNPGGLWGKAREDLADGRSCCRNPTLMKLMSLAPLSSGQSLAVEGNGGGIPFMLEEAAAHGLNAPEFHVGADSFRLVLRRPQEASRTSESVQRGERAIRALLKTHGEMSLRELVESSGLSTSQVRRRLNEMLDDGLVVATAPPTSRKRRYRLNQ